MEETVLVRKPNGESAVLPRRRWERCTARGALQGWELVRRLEAGADTGPIRHSVRPRIVHVIPSRLGVGGVQRMVDLWCQLNGHRWEIHVVSMGNVGPFTFGGATMHARALREEQRFLQVLGPDLIVHHNPTCEYGRYCGCPCVWIIHGMPILRSAPPTWCTPAAVFTNLDCADVHPSWRKLPFHVLSLGVDLDQFRPWRPATGGAREHGTNAAADAAPRQHPDAGRRPLICGIAGRMNEEKIPASFVKLLRRWRHGPWVLRFIGVGVCNQYQPWVRQQLKEFDWIEFAGDVAPQEMPTALRQLDVLLVPTDVRLGETGCYSAMEAMACGIPIVCRDVAGLRNSCRDAALYADSDRGLLSCLHQLENPERRAQLARRGRELAEREHALATHVAAHNRAFASALAVQVSVLTAAYNAEPRHLREFWESLRMQTLRAWELVLVDDGSTRSDTISEIDRISDDPRVRLRRLGANVGVARALNAGLALCRGDLVAHMDADDVMLPERLAKQLAYLRDNPDADILGAQIAAFDDRTGHASYRTSHPMRITEEVMWDRVRRHDMWFLNHPAVAFRKSSLSKIGGYPEDHIIPDLACWLKAYEAGLKICNMPEVLVRYRLHAGQITATAELIAGRIQDRMDLIRHIGRAIRRRRRLSPNRQGTPPEHFSAF